MLNRTQLTTRRLTIEPVPAPEFGNDQTIGVKLLSAGEFLKLSADAKDAGDEAYAFWITACVCDEAGEPIFTADDLDAVKALPFSLVNRVIEAAQRVNGTADVAKGN